MAAALEEKLGIDAQLVKGGGGVFDVTVDGDLIYSKHDTGQFPINQEVVQLIQDRRSLGILEETE